MCPFQYFWWPWSQVVTTVCIVCDCTKSYCDTVHLLTNIMGLVEHHYRLLGQLFGHQVSYLGVQQVVVAVHHNVGMQDLKRDKDRRQKLSDTTPTFAGPLRIISVSLDEKHFITLL